jgi:hypothetical protein
MRIRAVTKKAAELTEPLFCNRCGAILVEGSGTFYRVNIEAVADPAPPIISSEDLAKDPSEEIKKLLAQMKDLSAQEAMDQVYRRLTIFLCLACYRPWIENPAG